MASSAEMVRQNSELAPWFSVDSGVQEVHWDYWDMDLK
jgi:hypothetical protein